MHAIVRTGTYSLCIAVYWMYVSTLGTDMSVYPYEHIDACDTLYI